MYLTGVVSGRILLPFNRYLINIVNIRPYRLHLIGKNGGKERVQFVNIKSLPIKSLVHPSYNPRQISEIQFRSLMESLQRFEAVEPAVINIHPGREGIIIGGNQRVRCAEAMGWTEFPCVEIDLSPEKERELNIRLNANTGEWDFDVLANEFEVEELKELGFPESELKFFPEENILKENSDKTKKEKICPHCGGKL